MSERTNETLATLTDSYAIENEEAVAAFLTEHKEIIPSLEATISYLDKHFPGAKRTLTVELDEEDDTDEEGTERLYILITAPRNTADVQERMDRLDEEWAYDLCESTDELVVIDLDYT